MSAPVELSEAQVERCKWIPHEHDGWECDLGPLRLYVDFDGGNMGWSVAWSDGCAAGVCTSFEDGKRLAVACAKRVAADLAAMLEVLEPVRDDETVCDRCLEAAIDCECEGGRD